SACTTGAIEPSHVLTAMGVSPELAQTAVRLSLGKDSTEEEVDYCLQELPAIITRLRSMSPIYAQAK
ncbi:MAG: cysteine desulfurase NifS, partial [candidate division Zixibacteria bacterium]|nr:cysteine desulfurase NifS [candidate division Zixibacteria bacterium]